MTQAEIYTAVPEHLPKNFPFYNWVPKPLGIAFLVILFIPIMTVSGAYTVNSSEMVGGLGIQSEHINGELCQSYTLPYSATYTNEQHIRQNTPSLPNLENDSDARLVGYGL